MTIRSLLRRAGSRGSTRLAVQHWWLQRVTAVALIPLTLWLAVSIARLAGANHSVFILWVEKPWNAVLILMAIAIAFYHLKVGLDVVIEDYVHTPWIKVTFLIGTTFVAVLIGGASAFAILRIAL